MPSFKQCAILATALVGAVVASPQHLSLHKQREAAAVAAPVEDKRDVGDVTQWFRNAVLKGVNSHSSPVAIGKSNPYHVEFFNSNAEKDVDLVLWSSCDQAGTWPAMTINVTPPNITMVIPAGENRSVSFDPARFTAENGWAGSGSISGAWCAMYDDTPTSFFGGCADTWGEYTFVPGTDSTVDVSRLTNMNGHPMTIQTFVDEDAEMSCQSDMETCVYVCPEGQTSCNGAEATNCNGNTGCQGLGEQSGYTRVTFY